MAWNQPGGGRDQDPWGNKGRKHNGGPPDLEEALKQLKNKLSGLLGGGGKGSGTYGSGSAGFILIAILVAGLWALFGVFEVKAGEKAMILQFGKYHEEVGPGLHWVPRFVQSYHKVDVQKVSSYQHSSTMLTKDQNIVDIDVTVQYRRSDPRKYFLEVVDPIQALQFATQSALRHVVGGSTMDSVITEGRTELAQEVGERLREYLEHYDAGLSITAVNIEDGHPPEAVKEAFDDVTRAREDEEKYKNEADGYRRSIIPEARGRAERILKEAEAYKKDVIADATGEIERFNKVLVEYRKAPDIMRERMHLETLEKIYGRTPKVVIDESNSSNFLYLPLDKLMSATGSLRNSALLDTGNRSTANPNIVDRDQSQSKQPNKRVEDLSRRSGWGGR